MIVFTAHYDMLSFSFIDHKAIIASVLLSYVYGNVRSYLTGDFSAKRRTKSAVYIKNVAYSSRYLGKSFLKILGKVQNLKRILVVHPLKQAE